jgi:hypothetical protein
MSLCYRINIPNGPARPRLRAPLPYDPVLAPGECFQPSDDLNWSSPPPKRRETDRANITALPFSSALPQLLMESPERQPARVANHRSNIMTEIQTETAAKKKAPAKKAPAKKTSKPASKSTKKPTGGKGPGVIATIVECISREKGSTVDETLAVLIKAFPDRDPDGMRKTAMIQSNKQKTSKEVVDGRGTVFYKRR